MKLRNGIGRKYVAALGCLTMLAILAVPVLAQGPPPQYPPAQGPPSQYPPPQYPPAQGPPSQYPQSQYPPAQGPPSQYPQSQYPQSQYPPSQYPSPQYPPAQGPPPMYRPDELDRIVSRIALYPDPLLSQTLAASTFPDQIPAAARWADEHHYITGEALARTISEDRLPWDPSVQALLPFPRVLDMMASDPAWTSQLGNAFLSQQPEVMDAVQRMRHRAQSYGYLRSGPQVMVSNGPYIEIMPMNPGYIVVPYYSPMIVFAAPRPGFMIGGAINFGFGVSIGAAFRPWGWGVSRFGWGAHTVIVNNVAWNRNWVNRATYVHPYAVQRYPANAARAEERHEVHAQSVQERQAARAGHTQKEEHRHEEREERR